MTKRTESTTITAWTHDPAPQRFRQRTTRFRDPAAADPAPPSVALLETAADRDASGRPAPGLVPEFARDDECVEVTPEKVRIRKVVLDATERGRAASRAKRQDANA